MLQTAINDLGRLKDISLVLAKHGFDQIAEKLTGGKGSLDPELVKELAGAPRRFKLLLEDLGPTFVKLGQILSTRPDLLPSTYINELKTLQNNVAPVPFDDIAKVLEESLHQQIDEIFQSVEETPLASASIAQVHRATLKDGRAIILKVQRPGIEKTIRSDLHLLYLVARLLEATIEEGGIYRPVEIIQEFEQAIFQELDFINEARNTQEFGRNFKDEGNFSFAEIFPEISSRTVLCMEFLEGKEASDLPDDPHIREKAARSILDGYFQMVYQDGFFHGDPHPGNILVTAEGKVSLLDCGLVGRIPRGMQEQLVQLSLAIATRDADSLARVIYRLGNPVGRISLTEFRDEIQDLLSRYLGGQIKELNAGNLVTEMLDLALRHRIRLQPNFALLAKTAVTTEGVIRELNPDLDIVATVTPYTRKLIFDRYNPKTALKQAVGFLGSLNDMPLQLQQIVTDLETGRLTMNVQNRELDKLSKSLNDLGSKVFLGMLAGGFAVGFFIVLAQYPLEIQKVPVWPILALLALGGITTVAFWWHLLYGRLKPRKIRLAWWINLFRRKKSR